MKKILFIAVIFLALACSKKSDTQIECVICDSELDIDGYYQEFYCGTPDEVDAHIKKIEEKWGWYCKKEK
jgi:hypothetical protein